jgi:hypothetical protein
MATCANYCATDDRPLLMGSGDEVCSLSGCAAPRGVDPRLDEGRWLGQDRDPNTLSTTVEPLPFHA